MFFLNDETLLDLVDTRYMSNRLALQTRMFYTELAKEIGLLWTSWLRKDGQTYELLIADAA